MTTTKRTAAKTPTAKRPTVSKRTASKPTTAKKAARSATSAKSRSKAVLARATRATKPTTRSRKPAAPIHRQFLNAFAVLSVLVFGAIGIIGIVTSSLSHAAGPTVTGQIVGIDNKCLDNSSRITTNGNKIQLWACNNTIAQKWTVLDDGTLRVQDRCLDVKGASKTERTVVQLYQCNGTVAQKWTIDTKAKTIVNPNSGFCLDDQGARTDNGTQIWMYHCNGTNAQKWTVPTTVTAPTPAPAPKPAPAPSPPPTSDNPSGQSMPNSDLPGWKLSFNDDFNTGNVPLGSWPGVYKSRWAAYSDGTVDTAGQKNGGKSVYYPSKVLSINNGVLDWYLHSENGIQMSAAPVPIQKGFTNWPYNSQTYGRYSVRFKADQIKGFKTAWLLWPDSGKWPGDGEIDFAEGDLNGPLSAAVHRADISTDKWDKFDYGATFAGWHTATIEWSPGKVQFFMDGRLTGTTTTGIPHRPMHVVLQAERTLTCTNTSTSTCPLPSTAGHLQLDWIAMWSKN